MGNNNSIEVIETEVYKQRMGADGKPTGYLQYVGQRSIGEVFAELKTRLTETATLEDKDMSLWDSLDYFDLTWSGKRRLEASDDFPSCRSVAVFAVTGSNEGHYIHVEAVGVREIKKDGSLSKAEVVPRLIFVGKTFSGMSVALEISNTITRAFHR